MPAAQILRRLYSFETSSPDIPRYLHHLFKDDDKEQYLSRLQEPELSWLIDFLDKTLDDATLTGDVARRCLDKLQDICCEKSTLPSSYMIAGNLSFDDDEDALVGDSANIFQGSLDGKRVCVKRFRASRKNREHVKKRFCREAIMWKRMKHPNVVPFIGVSWGSIGAKRESFILVSEWMENATITEYVRDNSSADRVGLLLDVAEGLAYIHSNHASHGNVQGSNILINANGRACLSDFGDSLVVRATNSAGVNNKSGRSSGWTAPELLRSSESRSTQKADVFAFAMVVLEVFTGSYPFGESNPDEIDKMIDDGKRPPRPRIFGLTDQIWDMMVHCWVQAPADRPRMAQVVEILRDRYEPIVTSIERLPSSTNNYGNSRQTLKLCIQSIEILTPVRSSAEYQIVVVYGDESWTTPWTESLCGYEEGIWRPPTTCLIKIGRQYPKQRVFLQLYERPSGSDAIHFWRENELDDVDKVNDILRLERTINFEFAVVKVLLDWEKGYSDMYD